MLWPAKIWRAPGTPQSLLKGTLGLRHSSAALQPSAVSSSQHTDRISLNLNGFKSDPTTALI